jgi:putative ABC transport system permease protein
VRKLTRELIEELAGSGSLRRLGQDVRFGARLFARTPGVTATIVLALALGIGATTGMFSIVQTVLLRPLPYDAPDRLVAIWDGHTRASGLSKVFASSKDFEAWSRHATSFEQMAAVTWATGEQIVSGRGPAKVVLAIPATANLFSLLGVRAAVGRTFEAHDRGRGCTVVLAHHFWRDTLGSRPGAVGDRITLDDRACTIVGVMPSTFRFFPSAADMWRLIANEHDLPAAGVGVFGRLKPGVSRETAQAELVALHARADSDDTHRRTFAPSVYDLQQEFTWLAGRNLRLTLLALLAAVAFVLLIACLNVANLLLGRVAVRHREFAVRTALGSGRVRLLRQLLTESLLLAFAGAMVGALLAAASVQYFRAANPIELPTGVTVGIDVHVLMFTGVVAVLTALIFGLVPAWGASRADVATVLKTGGRTSTSNPRTRRLSKALVVAEMTCSVVLLVGAGLLIESVARLGTTPLGFDTKNLQTMSVRLPTRAYETLTARAGFYNRLLLTVGRIPGLDGVALATGVLRGRGVDVLGVRGGPAPSADRAVPDVAQDTISADYFKVMRVPLLAGRWFDEHDDEAAEAVAVVNAALARKYFPGESAVGRYVRYGAHPAAPWLKIVGVAGDQKGTNVHQEMNWVDAPFLFRPIGQAAPVQVTLILRAPAAAGDLGRSVPALVAALDPEVPVGNLQSLDERIAATMAYPLFRARLLGGFAALALFLAVAGLYGVLSQMVTQRAQEIGVRLALGAPRSAVLALVAKQGMLLTGGGLVAGLAIALWLGRFLRAMLYGIGPTDAVTLMIVSLVLAAAALLATWLPARRAVRIDPIVALRQD